MRRDLEGLERVDAEGVVDARGECRPDAGHRLEHAHRIERAPEPFELAPAAGPEHLHDRGCDATTDERERNQSGYPISVEDVPEIPTLARDGIRRPPVCGDAERIGPLLREEIGSLSKPVGDVLVHAEGVGRSPGCGSDGQAIHAVPRGGVRSRSRASRAGVSSVPRFHDRSASAATLVRGLMPCRSCRSEGMSARDARSPSGWRGTIRSG